MDHNVGFFFKTACFRVPQEEEEAEVQEVYLDYRIFV